MPTEEERQSLGQMVRSGKTPARTLTRARVLLKADCGTFERHREIEQRVRQEWFPDSHRP